MSNIINRVAARLNKPFNRHLLKRRSPFIPTDEDSYPTEKFTLADDDPLIDPTESPPIPDSDHAPESPPASPFSDASSFTSLEDPLPPDIQSQLYTNLPPRDQDRDELRIQLIMVQREISQLNMRIDLFVGPPYRMRLYSQERDSFLRLETAYKLILSPARQIPTEILCEIFLHVANSFAESSHVSVKVTEGAWVLSHVCSRWRSIAIDFRPLWTDVCIDTRRMYVSRDNKQSVVLEHLEYALETYLCRSGDNPLDIVFRVDRVDSWRYPSQPTDRIMNHLLMCIVRHSHRWKHVYLTLPEETPFIAALQQVKERGLSSLQKLSLKSSEPPDRRDELQGWLDISSATSLWSFVTSFCVSTAQIPWSQITRYEGHQEYYEGGDHLRVIQHMHSLVDCALLGRIDVPGDDIGPLVDLPHLRRLRVDGNGGIFDHLHAPSLESLEIQTYHNNELTHVLSFVRRSECTLASLTVRGPRLDHTLFRDSVTGLDYAEFSSLNALSIKHSEYSPTFFSHLSGIGDNPLPLPNIRKLYIETNVPSNSEDFSVDPIAGMLLSRLGNRNSTNATQLMSFGFLAHVDENKVAEFTLAFEHALTGLREMNNSSQIEVEFEPRQSYNYY